MLVVLFLLRLIFDWFEERTAHAMIARHRELTVEYVHQLCTRKGETKFRAMALVFVIIMYARVPSNLAYYGRQIAEAEK